MFSGADPSFSASKPGSIARAACRAAHEESRRDQQQHRERDFRDHEHLLQVHAAPAFVALGRKILERRHESRSRCLQGRSDAKHETREQRQDDREQEHASVDRKIDRDRQRAWRWWRRLERLDRRPSDRDPDGAADERQGHARLADSEIGRLREGRHGGGINPSHLCSSFRNDLRLVNRPRRFGCYATCRVLSTLCYR